jgi:hypothetical protein
MANRKRVEEECVKKKRQIKIMHGKAYTFVGSLILYIDTINDINFLRLRLVEKYD